MASNNAALSAEELETFRQWADTARRVNTFWSGQYSWTVARLLAEVERLRAREAALVEIVRAVAATGADFDMNTNNSWLLFPGLYAAEQCREQARTLLAALAEGE